MRKVKYLNDNQPEFVKVHAAAYSAYSSFVGWKRLRVEALRLALDLSVSTSSVSDRASTISSDSDDNTTIDVHRLCPSSVVRRSSIPLLSAIGEFHYLCSNYPFLYPTPLIILYVVIASITPPYFETTSIRPTPSFRGSTATALHHHHPHLQSLSRTWIVPSTSSWSASSSPDIITNTIILTPSRTMSYHRPRSRTLIPSTSVANIDTINLRREH